MSVEKECPHCHQMFVGRSNKQFCCDEHRWAFHAEKAPKKPRLSGKGCRDKGARVEREVCHLIELLTGQAINRHLGQARDGGADVDWGPFRLEVKARQTVAMPAWQAQVLAACAGTDMIPGVVWKRNAENFWIAIPFEAFVTVFNAMRVALESGYTNAKPEAKDV